MGLAAQAGIESTLAGQTACGEPQPNKLLRVPATTPWPIRRSHEHLQRATSGLDPRTTRDAAQTERAVSRSTSPGPKIAIDVLARIQSGLIQPGYASSTHCPPGP